LQRHQDEAAADREDRRGEKSPHYRLASSTRLQVSLNAPSAASNAAAGPVFNVLSISYLARHSLTAGSVVEGLGELAGVVTGFCGSAVRGFVAEGVSRLRQVSLKPRSAASNASAGPVFNVLRASYLARHSLTAGSVVEGLGVVAGLSVLAGGTSSERYFAQNASAPSPLATIAASQASFVLSAARE